MSSSTFLRYWSGDLGYIDEAGFLYFAGRRGDWIRVDGENTSALVIERVLRRHPAVVAAGVYGVPDPRSGDQVMAALEVADPDGHPANLQTHRALCRVVPGVFPATEPVAVPGPDVDR